VSSRARRVRRRGLSYRPEVEALEDRRLLTTLVALTSSNTLLTFDSSVPAAATTTTVTGLAAGESLQAIAVRPATGQLYALSILHLYTIDLGTGAATPVGNPKAILGLDANQLAMSFDPVADRLRVIAEQVLNKVVESAASLTVSPDTGLVVGTGTPPQYVTGDVNAGRVPRLSRLAYTNQVAGATAATLYGIDDMPIVPDNLVTLGGPSGVPAPDQGQVFSVAPTDSSEAFTIAGPDNIAFALAENDQIASQLDLFTVSLTSGASTLVRSAVASAMVTGLAALPGTVATLPTVSFNDVSVYAPDQGTVNAVFTVSLSSASTQPVTVQVQTRDGTAHAPTAYQALPATTVTLTPGQTSQPVAIPVGNSGVQGGVETFFIELSAPANATLGNNEGLATITNRPVVQVPPSQAYIDGFYLGFLGRFPAPAEQAAWQHVLDSGLSLASAAAAFQNSSEHAVKQVEDLYTTLLHRPADAPGLDSALAAQSRGTTLEELETGILGSPEYFVAHGGTLPGFLAGVYQDVLQRAVDPSGAAGWGSLLTQGELRALVAGLIVRSPEALAKQVQARYHHFLGSNPDSQALQSWTDSILGESDAAREATLAGLQVTLASLTASLSNYYAWLLDRAWLNKVYNDFFSRNPDPGGWDNWTNLLIQGETRDQVVYQIEAAPEFHRDYTTTVCIQLTGLPPDPSELQAELDDELSNAIPFDQLRESIFIGGLVPGSVFATDIQGNFVNPQTGTMDSQLFQVWFDQVLRKAIDRPFDPNDPDDQNELTRISSKDAEDPLFAPFDNQVISGQLYAQRGIPDHLAWLKQQLEREFFGTFTPNGFDPALILVDRATNGISGIVSDFARAESFFLAETNGRSQYTDGEPGFIANICANSAYFQ
jgi:hypothetical protein